MIWLGIILFFGLHIMPSVLNVRANLIARMGEKPYKGVYALLSLAGIVLMAMGYGNVDYVELWPTPTGANHLAMAVMPFGTRRCIRSTSKPAKTRAPTRCAHAGSIRCCMSTTLSASGS